MAIIFPENPSINDIFVFGSNTYKWDNSEWNIIYTQSHGLNLDAYWESLEKSEATEE